jgi:hypothetical protein
MGPVLERFVDMGVDCLNPMEPPPCASLTLAEAKQRVAGRMCLEGGVEDADFLMLEPEAMVSVTAEVMRQGKPGGGFILCPSSAPSTTPVLTETQQANYVAFVETGIRMGMYE